MPYGYRRERMRNGEILGIPRKYSFAGGDGGSDVPLRMSFVCNCDHRLIRGATAHTN